MTWNRQVDVLETLADPSPRALEAGRGLVWLQQGWSFFLRAPGSWLTINVLLVILGVFLALIPVVGLLLQYLIAPVFIAGLMLGCRSLDNGGGLTVDHLFSGFRQNVGSLMVVGLLFLVGVFTATLVCALLLGSVAAVGAVAGIMKGDAVLSLTSMISSMLLIGPVFALLITPLLMGFWFAPALVVFKGAEPWQAMRVSFVACRRNMAPFIPYSVLSLVFLVLACLPLFLGLMVFLPVINASLYASYVDIFE